MLQNFRFYTLLTFLYLLIGCKITEEPKSVPVVQTNSSNEITLNSAKVFGAVVEEGSSATNERGIVYSSQNPLPSTSDSKIISGFGKGEYGVDLSNLLPNTKYFFRAYAVNSIGIGYGSVRDFTTLQAKTPTVSTNTATKITINSFTTGGIITSDGGSSITERGIVYSLSQNPTISNSKITSASNQFSIDITGLNDNTTYYCRAFATNAVGTTYGDQIIVTTLKNFNNSLKNGMIGYYPFNGNSNDVSGKNNHMIGYGIYNMFDRFGLDDKSAYYFNGKDSYLIGPILSDLKSQISVSFWVKNKRTSTPAGWRCLITTQNSTSQGFLIQDNENLKYDLSFANANKSGYIDFWTKDIANIENWEYLTFTYDGNSAKFYRNGKLENSQVIGSVSLESNAKLYVGSRYNNEFFLGVMDELGIWNRALSDEEINYIFQNGFKP